jgi:hypothetical protein
MIALSLLRSTACDYSTYAATGGSNQDEHWLYPDQLGAAVTTTPGRFCPLLQ